MQKRMNAAKNVMAAAMVAGLLLFCGCKTYHIGTSLPPEQRCIAVDTVLNLTSEPELGTLSRNAMLEKLAMTPGISLATGDGANTGLTIAVTLRTMEQDNLARARTREKQDRDHDDETYQTVLYRITLEAEWEAIPANKNGHVRRGKVSATADAPLMSDHETAMRSARRQVTMDLASKVVSAVTD